MRRKAAEVSITIWNMNILTAFWIFYILSLMATVLGRLHPECEFIFQLKKDQQRCLKEITENENHTTEGCEQNWDAVMCWPLAAFGETVNVSCPPVFSHLMKNPASLPGHVLPRKMGCTVSRSCTINGWSNPFPPYYLACTIEDEIPVEEESYFATVKVIYTVGYGASIFSLTIAMIILLIFRSLHCARNYVHIQLFASFILRAVAVFIKDATLFANDETEHCTFSTAGCKAAVVFCHYCVMTNFFWLLVEALYLNSLLFSFLHRGRKYFRWFVLLGWGVPTICIIVWIISRMYFEDTECWDVNEISSFWWIIKGPIVVSIGVNFILFINIIRILIQKLDPQLIQFNNSSQYRRLMKSTLLLVPLFGTHYIVFNFLPDYINTGVRLYIELCLGSFQGLIVAVLYCFLNQEVQTEIRRKRMLWYINCYGEVPGVVKESDMDTPF